jgi:hypothetical protein
LVTTSSPAIEPAISILPVKNQLMANVSSVPSARQLTALRTDRACVSAPRKNTRPFRPFLLASNLPRRRTSTGFTTGLPCGCVGEIAA